MKKPEAEVFEIPEDEVFLDSNQNFAISVFSWGQMIMIYAKKYEKYGKHMLSNLI